MISKSELMRALKRELGTATFRLVTEQMVDEVLHDETLMTFSEFYPLLIDVQVTRDMAIPFQSYSGKLSNYRYYKLSKEKPTGQTMGVREYEWRDIENFYILGNDTGDCYTGGNFVLNQFFMSGRAAMPHTRSYYELKFMEPDIIEVSPPMTVHRNFVVKMQANRTLADIPRNMQRPFTRLFICDMCIMLYHEYAHDEGSQTYGGVEIDTRLGDLKDYQSERETLINDVFEKDWFKNPERFEAEVLYNVRA